MRVVAAFFFTLLFGLRSWGLCVSKPQTQLREEPGGKVTWVVGLYTPLIELERKGSWIRVQDQDSEKHWVRAAHTTNGFQCLSISRSTANLRVGPGEKFALAEWSFADRYTPFKRLERDDSWYKVEDMFGQVFWVNEKMVWRPLKVVDLSY